MKNIRILERRGFLKKAGLLGAGIGLSSHLGFSSEAQKTGTINKLPKWRGFNLLDFFSPEMEKGRKNPPEYLQWMADWGFDFVRIPISYPAYLKLDRKYLNLLMKYA
jgi:endoglucanase